MSPTDPTIQRLYTLESGGLPIDDVRVLAADAGGLWIGGLGAAHFDGGEWEVFTVEDGLAGTLVQALAIDSQLRAWIGTKTGLSIWNGDIFFNLTQENGLPSDNITALLADGDAMWIGSNGGGLFRFMRNQLQIFSDENADLPSNTITALGRDGDGALLVGTAEGLVRFVDGVATPVEDVPALPITAIASDGAVALGRHERRRRLPLRRRPLGRAGRRSTAALHADRGHPGRRLRDGLGRRRTGRDCALEERIDL